MKKLMIFAMLLTGGIFQSCTVNENPQPITEEFLAEVFEVNADFAPSNGFRNYYDLKPVIFDSDVLLVYEFAGTDKNGADIWKALPQIYTSDSGIHQYNFDFTKVDFSIFLDANFDRMRLNNSWRLGKVFRVVIVPGKFAKLVDKTNFQNVMHALNLNESSVVNL
jgi:hypothetical protein